MSSSEEQESHTSESSDSGTDSGGATKGRKKKAAGKHQSGDKGKRKRNFSEAETELVIAGIIRYDDVLHGPDSHNTSKARREAIYAKIASRVNALGHEVRTPKDIRVRWNDLKRRTKKKLARARRHANATGGGAPRGPGLTAAEEAVASVLLPEQISGVKGVDSGVRSRAKRVSPDEPCCSGLNTVQARARSRKEGVATAVIPSDTEPEDVVNVSDEAHSGSDTLPAPPDTVPHTVGVGVEEVEDATSEPMVMWDDSVMEGVAGEATVTAPPPPRSRRDIEHQHPAEWERDMLLHQGTQSHHMSNLTGKLGSIHASLTDMCQSIHTGMGMVGDNLRSLRDEVQGNQALRGDTAQGVAAAVGDVANAVSALCSTQHVQDDTLCTIATALAGLAAAAESQAASMQAIATCADRQATALESLAAGTTTLVSETKEMVQAIRDMGTDTVAVARQQGRHSRRLQHRQLQQQQVLHADTSMQLGRIATGVTMLQPCSETPSRSSTPSVESVQSQPTSQRVLRKRKDGPTP